MSQKALFLDRDGVINHDPGDYTKNLDEFHILDGALETMKEWFDAGYKLVIITNQAGLAKGLYKRHDVDRIHQYLMGRCVAMGFRIEECFYCPHHEGTTSLRECASNRRRRAHPSESTRQGNRDDARRVPPRKRARL